MATVCLQSQLRFPDADAAVRGACPRPPRHLTGPWRGLVSLDGAEHELRHMIQEHAQHDRAKSEEEHLVSNPLYYFHRDLILNTSQLKILTIVDRQLEILESIDYYLQSLKDLSQIRLKDVFGEYLVSQNNFTIS